ncbi:hypothetical protein [Amycolatopsis echigonensis]|uniref:hypothetical protein n=1 Tax=Amycolatopsis echigonensis TaxID=2576905 RepID=UPI001FC96CB0|nr:hypothetical protein [Amycolatopsis niigatensis]
MFDAGTRATLPDENDRLGLRRIMVVATPDQADQARDIADPLGAGLSRDPA